MLNKHRDQTFLYGNRFMIDVVLLYKHCTNIFVQTSLYKHFLHVCAKTQTPAITTSCYLDVYANNK